jgi:hypothetical protein
VRSFVPPAVTPRLSIAARLARAAVVCAALSASALGAQGGAPPDGIPKGAVKVPAGKIPDSVTRMIPKTLKLPEGDKGVIDARDERARGVIGFLNCMESTLRATRAGVLGVIAPDWKIVCVQEGKEWRGVVAELRPIASGAVVHAQYALRGAGQPVRDPVDTALVAALARAMVRGNSVPAPGGAVATFLPAVLHQRTFVEVWFVPAPNAARLVVGGDSVIQMTADGVRELGHSSKSPPPRLLAAPTVVGNVATIQSIEDKLPLVSEFVAARTLLVRHPTVKLRSNWYEFTLSRSTDTWVVSPR